MLNCWPTSVGVSSEAPARLVTNQIWPDTIRTKDWSSIICAATETAADIAGPPDNKGVFCETFFKKFVCTHRIFLAGVDD